MSLQLEVINPIEYRGWDELLSANHHYDFFHTAAWARVLFESYQYKPTYLALIDRPKLLISIPLMEVRSALTGRRGVSLPFTDFCDPFISNGISPGEIIKYLIDFSKNRGWKYFEIRGGNSFEEEIRPSSYFYDHTIDITRKTDEIFANLRTNMKRNIKKAGKNGVELTSHHSFDSIKEYYRLHCLTRQKHGLPPQPFSFFKNIHRHIISRKMGQVILAKYKNTNIAGAIYFHFGDNAIYKFGASDLRYQHLRPNNLVMWEAIKNYANDGLKHFSFGRTEPENDGLRQFKSGWGTEEKIVNYFKYDVKQKAFIKDNPEISNRYHKIFNKMPIPLLRSIGAITYKHMG